MPKTMTRRSFLKNSALAGAGLSLATTSFLPLRSWGAEPLKILHSNTFSGPYAEVSENSRKGCQLAVEMFGGKVLGRPIEIVERDAPNPAEAVKKAQEAVEKLGIKFLFSSHSGMALAVSEYAAKQQVVHIASAGADDITGKKCNRFTFRWPAATFGAINEVVPRIIDVYKATTFYTITPKYVFGEDLLSNTQEVLKNRKLTLLGNSDHPLGETDFSSHITKAMAAKADCVLFLNFSGDATNAIKQANSFGLHKVSRIACAWGSDLSQFKAIGAKVLDGVIFGLQYYYEIDSPGNKKFVEAHRKRFNETPTYSTAMFFTNMMTLLQCIERAKSDDPNKVVRVMEGYKYEGVTGPEEYRACDHQAVRPYYTVLCKGQGAMKTPDDFAHIIGFSTKLKPCAETGCKMS